jgi:phosphohistidine phosphatase SixA/8-oxo-dGTP pyrophosphatase MutT (NUDIX family)
MSSNRSSSGPVRAAGGVLWRPGPVGSDGPDVALVHRNRHDDWSLPKGKLDRGEHWVSAAAREIREETGVEVTLSRKLPTRRYLVAENSDGTGEVNRPKVVHYWAAQAIPTGGDHDAVPEDAEEIDAVEWLPAKEARARLTYPGDTRVLDGFLAGHRPLETRPEPVTFVLLRHAKALGRSAWKGRPDELRPLHTRGRAEAASLIPVLAAYGVERVLSSDSTRCAETVAPYAASRGVAVDLEPSMSEEAHDVSPERTARRAARLLRGAEVPTVLCSHRPVMPDVVAALLAGSRLKHPKLPLPPAGMLVLHVRDGVVEGLERQVLSSPGRL